MMRLEELKAFFAGATHIGMVKDDALLVDCSAEIRAVIAEAERMFHERNVAENMVERFRTIERPHLWQRIADLEAALKSLVFEVMDSPADICCGCSADVDNCEANKSKQPIVSAALKARAVLERVASAESPRQA